MADDSLPMFIRRFAEKHPYAFRYGSAVLISVAALVIVLILPYHRQQPVLLFFEAGVALATWVGGWSAGVVALIGGTAASAYFAQQNIGAAIVMRMVLNLTYTVGIIWVVAKLRSSQEALRQSEESFRRLNAELEQRVAERTAQVQAANQELLKENADRKQAEKALRRSEAYLAEAQRLTHTGSWASKVGEALYFSDENFRIWGFDPLQGPPDPETVFQRVHPEDRDKVAGYNRKVLHERRERALEFRIVLPDGTVKHIHAVGHPVFNANGEPVEFVGTHVDVTERKRAEEERERLRQLEADLVHMNRVSMLGELAASLAHEIKQPIAAAITNADACLRWLARDEPDVQEAREAATRIVQDGNRAAEVMNHLRSFYMKGATAERELVDVNEVLREMLVLLRNEANRYSISMRTEIAANLPKVRADRVQLQQVLMNLILNGIEAMKDTAGDLTIKSELGHDGQLVISVSDTGVGLPPEKADRIFDAFFTTKPQGSGMGLAISRSIVESHGGRLWASASTRGAVFCFTLPTVAVEAQP